MYCLTIRIKLRKKSFSIRSFNKIPQSSIILFRFIYLTTHIARLIAFILDDIPLQITGALLLDQSAVMAEIISSTIHFTRNEFYCLWIKWTQYILIVFLRAPICIRRFVVKCTINVFGLVTNAGVSIKPLMIRTKAFDCFTIATIVEILTSSWINCQNFVGQIDAWINA